jgi:RNAse (barnase) inhibitor barstar
MSTHPADFIFCDGLSQFREGDDFVARVPAGIANRDQLFDVLSRQLSFPSYFGRNWDALSDCLRDLSWIDRHRVIIAHEAVPDLDAITLRTYLELLAECVKDWRLDEKHELLVLFPEGVEAEIRRSRGQENGAGPISPK